MSKYRDFREAQKEHYREHLPKEPFIEFSEWGGVPKFIPQHNDHWGRWIYDERNFTLDYHPNRDKVRTIYSIPLRRVNSTWQLVNWQVQLVQKVWTDAEDTGNLFNACHDLFGGIRGTLTREDFDPIQYLKQRKKERKG